MRLGFAMVAVVSCASNHGHPGVDSGGSGDEPCDHAITTPSCWTVAPAAGGSGATQFAGGAYDGHDVYFAPFVGLNAQDQDVTTGTAVRYDPTQDFASAAAWTTFDATTIAPDAQGFQGAAFDGHDVYFVPYVVGMPFDTPADNGVIARFDPSGSFIAGSAWTAFDLGSAAIGEAFRGETFDGRYLYLPVFTDSVARYDTMAAFGSAASWTRFDAAIATSSPDLDMNGAVFDGRYVYFVPGDATSVVARYDTTATFGSAASWAAFDLSDVSTRAKSYIGGAFDGRYLYLAPGIGAPIVRFDTTVAFGSAASWTTFDPTPLVRGSGGEAMTAIGFQGAGFDGRHVYFVPDIDTPTGGAAEPSGQVMVFDTSGDFSDAAAWSSFDTRTLDASAAAYFGAVFDGRYMYFPPASVFGRAARFDASPPTPPDLPQFHGSFY